MIPESILEILFFIVMILLGYQAIVDLRETHELKDRLNELEVRVEALEKKFYYEN